MSARVVHGVNGRNDGRTSMPCVREELDRARGVGRGVALVEPSERLVVQRLERGHHEQAPRVAQLGQEVLVREHVLDLDGAVERDGRGIARAARARCASSAAARSGSRGRRT